MFKGKFPLNSQSIFHFSKRFVATKEFTSNLDNKLNRFLKAVPTKSIAVFLAGVNISFFIYSNFRLSRDKRWEAISGVSYSLSNFRERDPLTLINSLLGSRNIEDLAFETGILLTIGKLVEKKYGLPFFFKFFLGSFYIGILTSLFFVKADFAKNNRYFIEDPKKRTFSRPEAHQYRFQSAHGFSSGLLYFYLIKNRMPHFALPLILVDLLVWGPYYSSGILSGLAFALVI